MTTIRATVSGGRLKLDVPVDWPDGTEVEVLPRPCGDDGRMSEEEIKRVLAAMERIEPFDMTEAEEQAIGAERQVRKDRDKAAFAEHAEKLKAMWP